MRESKVSSVGELLDKAHEYCVETGFYERYWAERDEWNRLADLEPDPKKAFYIRYGIGSWKK